MSKVSSGACRSPGATEKALSVVIIDDIDRLTPDEALLVFRLVKSVGRLPNVMYLIAFDRELAEKAVKERYPSEGPHFLEKIIQAYFRIAAASAQSSERRIFGRNRETLWSIHGPRGDTSFYEYFL